MDLHWQAQKIVLITTSKKYLNLFFFQCLLVKKKEKEKTPLSGQVMFEPQNIQVVICLKRFKLYFADKQYVIFTHITMLTEKDCQNNFNIAKERHNTHTHTHTVKRILIVAIYQTFVHSHPLNP